MNNPGVLSNISAVNLSLITIAIIWSLIWKGIALWRSARLGQRKWFMAMLILNTLGILEIIYLLFVSKNYKVEVIEE